MAYQKQTFVDNETILSAAHMDHIEDGIMECISYTEQELTPEQKAQARANIGTVISSYYYTEREELEDLFNELPEATFKELFGDQGVTHNTIKVECVYALYDALEAKYPNFVQKNELSKYEYDGAEIVLNEYVIAYNTDGYYTGNYDPDDPARKPKYLIMSGIHGSERKAVFSAYRFVRDILNGHNVPDAFRNGVVLHVLPVANPAGFKANSYEKPAYIKDGEEIEAVNINRNFDWDWEGRDGSGTKAMSEPETQAIANWMADNSDAVAFIDCHNSIILNENVMISGSPDNDDADRVKRAAMRGVDRIIPYWRDVIGYTTAGVPMPDENGYAQRDENGKLVTEPKPVIFSYSVTANIKGGAFNYAQNVVGIPSIALEMLTYYGDARTKDEEESEGIYKYQPEVIAMGAEAIGNVLIELFSEASEVKDMAGVKETLEKLSQSVNSGFHAVTGSFNVPSDLTATGTQTYTLPCPEGAKLLVVEPDETTYAKIMAKSDANYTLGFCCNFANKVISGTKDCLVVAVQGEYGPVGAIGSEITREDSGHITVNCLTLLSGDYTWTAYFWNEGDAIPAWTGGSY